MSNSQKLRVIFKSDWHIGTGTGIPGSIDRLIIRDADGFPCIPAKTVNGIWRDSLETLTNGLGDDWQKWGDFIFGNQPALTGANPTITPTKSKLNLQPARISKSLREKFSKDERFKQALTFLKPGIAIDDKSGTTKPDHLRFEEMGRNGTVLETEFELQTDDKTAEALLILSAELVERIGGKRRRGAGKCVFEVEGLMSKEDAIAHIKSKGTDAKFEIDDISIDDENGNKYKFTESTNSTEWQKIEYKITLQSPVSIVAAILGNVSESLDFIPGTYLLPHITKNIDKDIFPQVANGDFQVSPATVEIDKNRGLPIPKVFAKQKVKAENSQPIYNRLKQSLERKPQTKPMRSGYISSLDDMNEFILFEENLKTLLIHNTVEDEKQRPTSEVGGVFSREAIKARTVMRGTIRWKKTLDLTKDNFSNLKGKIRLGTSKKDDYGLAEFTINGDIEDATSKAKKTEDNKLYVYLESDLIIRNDNLQQTNLANDLAKILKKELGVKTLTKAKSDDLMTSLVQVRRIESWNVGWGFPRPTLTPMMAGSVVVFDVSDDLDEDKLNEIEASGIGERRGEGFGRICFNSPILMNDAPEKRKKFEITSNNNKDSDFIIDKPSEEYEFAKHIELTAWREELRVTVLKIASQKTLREEIFGFDFKEDIPPMSQIGNLRSIVMRLRKFDDKQIVLDWLEHLKATNNRIEKWDVNQNITKAQKLVDNKLITLFKDPKEVWKTLCKTKINGVNVWNPPKRIVWEVEDLQNQLWAETIRSLFYACQHAHKRDLEKKAIGEAANG